jgi:hypothetical protein
MQQAVQQLLIVIREASPHELEQARVDERADTLDKPVRRAEGGQLVALAHQLFDRGVDQVGGMVLNGGCGMDC